MSARNSRLPNLDKRIDAVLAASTRASRKAAEEAFADAATLLTSSDIYCLFVGAACRQENKDRRDTFRRARWIEAIALRPEVGDAIYGLTQLLSNSSVLIRTLAAHGLYSTIGHLAPEDAAVANAHLLSAGFSEQRFQAWSPVEEAERWLHHRTRGRKFSTLDDCSSWLRDLLDMKGFEKFDPDLRHVDVNDGNCDDTPSGRRLNPLTAIISLPPSARDKLTILHQLAHCLKPEDGHGAGFAHTYLGLVERFMTPKVYETLRMLCEIFHAQYLV